MKKLFLIIALFTASIGYSSAQDFNLCCKVTSPKRFAIKVQPIKLLLGHYIVNYEQSLTENTSLDFELGMKRVSYLGIFETPLAIEPQYSTTLKLKRFIRRGYADNILNGAYIAPVITAGTSSSVRISDFDIQPVNNKHVGLLVDFGYQFASSKSHTVVDLFFGIGTSFNSAEGRIADSFGFIDDKVYYNNNTHYTTGKLALRFGLKTGLNFENYTN
jgi:hypothetical protein